MSETRDHWLHDFFDKLRIGDAHRRPAARACAAWWQTEGGATFGKPWHGAETNWNPFNTTRTTDSNGTRVGSHDQPGNSIPVQVFDSRAGGIAATVATMEQENMSVIRHRLVTDGFSAYDIARAIYHSPWGTGHLIFDVLDDIVRRGLYDEYARKIMVYPS